MCNSLSAFTCRWAGKMARLWVGEGSADQLTERSDQIPRRRGQTDAGGWGTKGADAAAGCVGLFAKTVFAIMFVEPLWLISAQRFSFRPTIQYTCSSSARPTWLWSNPDKSIWAIWRSVLVLVLNLTRNTDLPPTLKWMFRDVAQRYRLIFRRKCTSAWLKVRFLWPPSRMEPIAR